MAKRATYTEADQARVYVVLTTNEGNVKRTARDTGLPESTIRRWKQEWEKNGPPSTEEVERAVGDFVTEASELRGMALTALRKKVEILLQHPEQVKVAELTTLVGVLDDKISRARGLDTKNRVDHYHHLPAADEIRELMEGFVQAGVNAAARRQEEIVDAEIVEQAPEALPAPRP